MRSLRPLELVVGLSLAGSVLAAGLPAFVRNVRASRLAEPLDGLKQIGERATMLAREREIADAYPPSAPLTPAQVPEGVSVEDSLQVWDHPTWRELGFRLEHAHYFSFAFESKNGRERSSFMALAHGDLDGDGLWSTFQLGGEYDVHGEPILFPPEIQREVE